MNMLLYLPPEEQASFADENFKHFYENPHFNEHQLYKCANREPDLRKEDLTAWASHDLGNLAYMAVNSPPEFRERWGKLLADFVEDKLISGKAEIASYEMMGNSGTAAPPGSPESPPAPKKETIKNVTKYTGATIEELE